MPITTGSQDSASMEFQIALLVSVDDEDHAVSSETLRRLGHGVAEALELGADLLANLEERGWRARLSAEGGYVGAWLEKTSLRDIVHADLQTLPVALYNRLLAHLPILAKHDSEIEELLLTKEGFAPYL